MNFARTLAAWRLRPASLAMAGIAGMTYYQHRQPQIAFTESKPEAKWAALPNPASKTTEPVTQTEFANSVRDIENNLLRLAACSVRCMLGLCYFHKARAYSFAVYLETNKVTKDLNELNALPTQVRGAAPFIPAMKYTGSLPGYVFFRGDQGLGYYLDKASKLESMQIAYPVMIRLVMLHDVDGEHLSHGFDKTLKNRLTKHITEENAPVVWEQFGRFKHELEKLDKLEKGTQLDFYRNSEGCLTMCRDGVALITFDCLLLGWGVVDAFLGKEGHLKNKQPLLETIDLMLQVKPLTEM